MFVVRVRRLWRLKLRFLGFIYNSNYFLRIIFGEFADLKCTYSCNRILKEWLKSIVLLVCLRYENWIRNVCELQNDFNCGMYLRKERTIWSGRSIKNVHQCSLGGLFKDSYTISSETTWSYFGLIQKVQ